MPDLKNVNIHSIKANWLPNATTLDVLRLDNIHPVVSGNKWFKLKYYLADARQQQYKTVATFGGAYSNHIIATAYACKENGFKSIGIIRGEKPAQLSGTLLSAAEYSMQLQFVTRDAFKNKELLKQQFSNTYWIDEGGYGSLGATGAGEILSIVDKVENYSHIVCAVGTGTMFAGLINSIKEHQRAIGISVLKNNYSIHNEVVQLLHDPGYAGRFTIFHDYHFGGYAKHPAELIAFMNDAWHKYQLPTDIVYTAKTFYAVRQLITRHIIPQGSNVLMIHSGGLQGNTPLQKGVLPF